MEVYSKVGIQREQLSWWRTECNTLSTVYSCSDRLVKLPGTPLTTEQAFQEARQEIAHYTYHS